MYRNAFVLLFALKLLAAFLLAPFVFGAPDLATEMSGEIVLDVDVYGEPFYIDPESKQPIPISHASEVLFFLESYGKGIRSDLLEQIPIDGSEMQGDFALQKKIAGSILLDIEHNGEAWYVHPESLHRFALGNPDQAWKFFHEEGRPLPHSQIMRLFQ